MFKVQVVSAELGAFRSLPGKVWSSLAALKSLILWELKKVR